MRNSVDHLPPIPGDLYALMAEVGPKWRTNVAGHVDLMIARFSEVLKDSPRDRVTIHRNIVYGSHDRQVFDVYLPDPPRTDFPVVLFTHGGAFVNGHRNRSPEIYSNVLIYLARMGIAGINIGYRLATDVTFPGATEDIAAVFDWAHKNSGTYGWDSKQMFLMGHSAGAAHAGSYAFDPRFRGQVTPAGMIVISGRVRLDNLSENPNAKKVEQYYGTDTSKFEGYSPVSHISAESVPTFVAWAEYENPLIDVYCSELVYRLAVAKRRAPPSMYLKGHNHTSAIGHIGTADEALGRAIVDFIKNPR